MSLIFFFFYECPIKMNLIPKEKHQVKGTLASMSKTDKNEWKVARKEDLMPKLLEFFFECLRTRWLEHTNSKHQTSLQDSSRLFQPLYADWTLHYFKIDECIWKMRRKSFLKSILQIENSLWDAPESDCFGIPGDSVPSQLQATHQFLCSWLHTR